MKLTIGDYEVEIKARDARLRQRMNKGDTQDFLNMISMYLDNARDELRSENLNAFADEADKMGNDIYEVLKDAGVYD